MNNNNELWGLLVVGGPLLLGIVLLWATLNNRRSKAEVARTERATAALYEEQDRIDKANEHETKPTAPLASDAINGPETGRPSSGNISTQHQKPGDAKRPSDTLDRPHGAIPAKDWQPGRDEGRTLPADQQN
jgi:hypothetical protein